MNLIQIKQIDGLNDSLNSLASSIYNLNQEIDASFSDRDNFWNQLYYDSDHVIINSPGSTVNGEQDIALAVSQGGILGSGDSVFSSSLKVAGDLLLTNNTGQLVYLDPQGNQKRFSDTISINQATISSSSSLSSDQYIVGVNTLSNSVNLTLPPPSKAKEIIIKDQSFNASINNITITPNSSETIDGSLNFKISGDGGFASVYSDGANWYLNSKDAKDTEARVSSLEDSTQKIISYSTGTLPTSSENGTMFLTTDGSSGLPSMVYFYDGFWRRVSDNVIVAP